MVTYSAELSTPSWNQILGFLLLLGLLGKINKSSIDELATAAEAPRRFVRD